MFAVALAIVSFGTVAVRLRTGAPARIVRAVPTSPYLNTRPQVRYVGDDACVRCHPSSVESYKRHPMSRSLTPISAASLADPALEDGRVLFEDNGITYSIEHQGGNVLHRETRRDRSSQVITRNDVLVQYALGSGRQGISYLAERDGFIVESPMTWYVHPHRWGLSPGFEVHNYQFDRPVRPGCLYCHANRVRPVAGPINRYEPPVFEGHAIGCERCHGPGELHVKRPAVIDGKDLTIVNPPDLSPPLREAVCEQCHLLGDSRTTHRDLQDDDFRPGLPFQSFWTVLTPPADAAQSRFVGQVEQMHESRCFRESDGKLGCLSCHDPHHHPASEEKVAYYRDRCLECHGEPERGCRLSNAARSSGSRPDDCVSCHMPRLPTADIAHGAASDHRIPRVVATVAASEVLSKQPANDRRRLLVFHADLLTDADRADADRDRGVALSREEPRSAKLALTLLTSALSRRPDDATAWESKGYALRTLEKNAEAAVAFRSALDLEPNRESTITAAAYLAARMMRIDDAVAFWRRAITVNPWRSDYRAELALVHFRARHWTESAAACRETLRLNPAWLDVRRWLFQCLLYLGDIKDAHQELEILLTQNPADRDELLRTFSTLSGSTGEKP
jgi:Tfp pilus assembly protein PilF